MAGAAFAQSGVVKSNGLPIPGATVTAIQDGHKTVTSTDENGAYSFDNLAPGKYTIEVTMFGFRLERREVDVPGKTEFSLQVLPRQEAAGMRARANGANGEQAQINNDIANATLPPPPPEAPSDAANESFLLQGTVSQGITNGREDAVLRPGFGFGDFPGQQQPGFDANGPNGNGAPGGPGQGGGRQGGFGGRGAGFPGGGGFGGGRGGPGGGGRGPGGPGGRGGRGNNNSGAFIGNRGGRGRDTSLHGAIFYQFGSSAFNAAPYSFTDGQVPKADYSSSRFGVTIGGPLQIPKLFKTQSTYFFLNYFGTRASTFAYNVGTVPTALERTGDFSQSMVNGRPVSVFDPTTHQAFPTPNVIPQNMLNQQALGLLQFIPLPNQPGTVNNFVFTTSVPQNTDNLNVRFNQNITSKDRFAENFNLQDRDGQNAQLFGFLDPSSGRGISSNFSWTRNLGAHSVNVVTVGFNRNRSTLIPYFADKTDVAAELGINGVSHDPTNFGPPNLSFTNYASLSDGSPSQTVTQYGSITEAFTFVKGSHNFQTGMTYRRTEINTHTDSNGRGSFSFSGLLTSAFDANGQPVSGTGYDFADYLLGLPQSSSVRFGDTSTYFRGNQWATYFQDDWRLRSNLTLNLGIRWEYYSPLSEKYGHIANLDVAPGFTAAAVVTPGEAAPYSGPLPASLIRPDKHDWAPRAAIAWKPFPKRSLQFRAGYGINYNPTVYNQFASRLAAQPPFADTASLVTSTIAPLTIANGLVIDPSGKTILNTWAVDPNYQVGYAQSWNVGLQQDLPKNMILDLNYIGTKGTHLDIETIPNRSTQGSYLTSEQQRQIGNATGFTWQSSNANSIYEGLQARVIRRFRRGISFGGTYTFSKSIDNSSTFGGVGNTVAQNPFDISAERGLSSFDQRHVLNFNYNFTAPKSTHAILSDWQLTGGITATSGTPFTARVLGNQANIGGTGSVGSGRAEATGLPIETGSGYFNLLAFTVPAPGTLGDAARNTIPGLAQWSWNSAFGRSFRFGETRRSLEFRIEANNILNHVNYTSIGTVVNASNYGIPLTASGMRSIQANVRFRF